MKINKTIEVAQGVVKFEGEIDGPELDLVIEAGLRTLFLMGIIQPQISSAMEEKEGNTVQ